MQVVKIDPTNPKNPIHIGYCNDVSIASIEMRRFVVYAPYKYRMQNPDDPYHTVAQVGNYPIIKYNDKYLGPCAAIEIRDGGDPPEWLPGWRAYHA